MSRWRRTRPTTGEGLTEHQEITGAFVIVSSRFEGYFELGRCEIKLAVLKGNDLLHICFEDNLKANEYIMSAGAAAETLFTPTLHWGIFCLVKVYVSLISSGFSCHGEKQEVKLFIYVTSRN